MMPSASVVPVVSNRRAPIALLQLNRSAASSPPSPKMTASSRCSFAVISLAPLRQDFEVRLIDLIGR